MGKFDNYSNEKNIRKAQKKLDRLMAKRTPNQGKIDLARQKLETAKLFGTCQIFGREDILKHCNAPNADIMFSDDNRVMMFFDKLIRYKDIIDYQIVENTVIGSRTTKAYGSVSGAIIGGAIAGEIGALVGALSSDATSRTELYESVDGFLLQIFLRNGDGFQCKIPNSGTITNKPHRTWLELGAKLQQIIDENMR